MSYRTAITPARGSRKGQKISHEGGVVFQVDPFTQLRRFLILGSLSGSFYASGHDLTKENLSIIDTCLRLDPVRTIDSIVEVSANTLAASNEPALVALAKASAYGINDPSARGAEAVRDRALSALPQVARTGTHLLHFVEYVSTLRGWGTVLRRHIGAWYLGKSPKNLAFQVTKYQSRDGWSHKDVLRLVHPKAPDPVYDGIFNYVVNDRDMSKMTPGDVMSYLEAVNTTLSEQTDKAEVIRLIGQFNLPREVINSKYLNDPDVQAAMLPHMGIHALLRNLGNFSKSGLITPLSDAERMVVDKLLISPGMRLHPVDVLKAQRTYSAGRGMRGSGTWKVSQSIDARLNDLFYESFKTIEPTGKKLYLAVDCSGSMSWQMDFAPNFSRRTAAAVLAMVTARTEDQFIVRGFNDTMQHINIKPNDTLDRVEQEMENVDWGWTRCELPILEAMNDGLDVDAFIIYTDSDTGYGEPVNQVFERYQQQMGKPDSKFIVNAMVANDISLADPDNPNMLDVVGFSSDTPAVMSNFIRGLI